MTELYHISFRADLGGVMLPRQPDGSEFENGELISTEQLPARISFAPTIEQCFIGIYPNISQMFEKLHYPYMVFYVYRLRPTSLTKYIDKSTVLEEIHDAHITEEVCVSTKAYVDKVSKIKIMNCVKNKELFYRMFNDPNNTEQFLCHQIEWSHLERFRNSDLPKKVKLTDPYSLAINSRLKDLGATIR